MNILQKISSVITYNKIGIVVVCTKKSSYDISYYQMLKKGYSADICFAQEGFKTFDEIDVQSEKYPTILCIQGTGLVQRMMSGSYDDIRQNIPNINTEEYLIELDETNQDEKLVALFRKEQVETIMHEGSLTRIPIHDISLGLVNISMFLQLFIEGLDCFEYEGNAIYFNENKVLEIRKNKSSNTELYFFAGKSRKATEILALAAGLSHFSGKTWNVFKLDNINEKVKEYTASKLSFFIIYYLGATLFVLLFVNFLLFDHYNTRRNELEVDSQGITAIQNEISQLQADVSIKRQFIQQNNVPQDYAFSFYADRLASFVTDGIRLTELSVCPVKNKVKEDKVIVFQNKTLHIAGIAPNSTAFSSFLEKINKASWVKELNKQVYEYNNENDNADFEIEIVLNNAID